MTAINCGIENLDQYKIELSKCLEIKQSYMSSNYLTDLGNKSSHFQWQEKYNVTLYRK
jgi:hypothetical protein